MPELQTLYVRIEADLSAFKSGMAEARRETQGFAKEARNTLSGVGDALDLRKFRDELAASEKATKQSADRMKKAFAEVGEVQVKTARKTLKILTESIGAKSKLSGKKSGAKTGRSSNSKGGEVSDYFSRTGAFEGAGIASALYGVLALTVGAATAPVSAPTLALFLALSAAIGGLTPAMNRFSEALSSDDPDTIASLDARIKELNARIEELDQPSPVPEEMRHLTEPLMQAERLRVAKELEAAQAKRKALLDIEKMANDEFLVELQRLYGDSASQYQGFLGAVTELSDCLRELCARIDTLAPLPSGGAEAARPGGVGFEGAGLARFNRELEATGWRAGDAAARIAELTERAGGYRAEAGALVRVLREGNAAFDDQVGVVRLLDALLPELGAAMTGVFTEAGAAGRDLDRVFEGLGGTLVEAFKDAAFEGESFREVLLKIIQDVLVLSQSSVSGGGGSFLGGLFDSLGGLFGGGAPAAAAPAAGQAFATPTIPVAKGNVFLRGDTLTAALARGGVLHNGVVNRPTLFAMAKGYGLMGEAGPEAVMPLTRLPNGELGVRSLPGGVGSAAPGPVVTYNIDARGADREGLSRLTAVLRQLDAKVNYLDRTMDRRAVEAVVYTRGRGGNIARAFGGW